MKATTLRHYWAGSASVARGVVLGMLALIGPEILRAQQAEMTQAETPPAAVSPSPAPVRSAEPVRLGPIVEFWHDVTVKSNETAEAVVAIFGSVRIDGRVRQTVVAIGGNIVVNGEVDDEVVAVGGDITTSGRVHRDVVAVGGNINLESETYVGGDVVAVGGRYEKSGNANVRGQINPVGLPELASISKWFRTCVLKFRPLALDAGWLAWTVAGVFSLLYLLTALAFPGAVQSCVNQLNDRPATTFLTGLLTRLILPLVVGLLALTGIGLVGVPFLSAAELLAKLFGKAALFIYLGQRLTRPFKAEAPLHWFPSFGIGWFLVTALYLVPFLGLFTMLVFNTWAIGVAIMAVLARSRKEAPPRPAPVIPSAPFPPPTYSYANVAAASAFDVPAAPPAPFAVPPPQTGAGRVPPTIPSVGPGAVPDTLLYPRANFGRRVIAGALDLALVGIVWLAMGQFIHTAATLENHVSGHYALTRWLQSGPWFPFLSVAYFAGMWVWRGTTVGGIVTNLKLVRLDGQPITVTVALVRTLAAWFSGVVLFLGFFWIAWDREQQGWHDKIAGTAVVRLPRSAPLVCL